MEVIGDPFLVLPDANFPSVSRNGTLAVLRGATGFGGELVWITPEGNAESIGDGGELVQAPRVSPDGRRIAFAAGSSPGDSDVWVRDLEREFNSRISRFNSFVAPIAWSPDSSEIAVLSFDPGEKTPIVTHFLAADGSGPTRESYEGMIVSIDHTWTYAAVGTDPRLNDRPVKALRLEDRSELGTVLEESGRGPFGCNLSPDGTLLLYGSSDSGQNEVYCTRFPGGEGRWQVSTNGASTSHWSGDGTRIYYQSDAQLYEVTVTREPELRFSRPRAMFQNSTIDLDEFQRLIPSRIDERFVSVRISDPDDPEKPLQISIIENWFEDFRNENESKP
jgi:Tol biopolymer transport system component